MINSAGIDFLDRNVLEAVKPGMRLPPPPPGYANSPGGTFMFVAFQHHLGEVHVLRPEGTHRRRLNWIPSTVSNLFTPLHRE